MMARYYVGFKTGAFAGTEVEANSRDEAIEIADNEFYASLCHQEKIEIGEWVVDFAEEIEN
jgi:hypothetical protein